jgi:hypothetical protein
MPGALATDISSSEYALLLWAFGLIRSSYHRAISYRELLAIPHKRKRLPHEFSPLMGGQIYEPTTAGGAAAHVGGWRW